MPNQRQLRDITDNDAYYSGKLLSDLVKKIANKKSKSMIKVIDPCAGKGDLTPKGAFAADIKPIKKGIKKVDFLKSSLKDYGVRKKGKIMFVMNPPFSIGDGNSSGWELFLNKAATLCEGRPGSCIITICYATKSQMEHIDKIDRHLHIEELHIFDSKSEAHMFARPNNKTSKVPIIVQVWKWKHLLRKYTPLKDYSPSKNIPFSIDGSSERKYFVKVWTSPAKIGEITEKKSVIKEGRKKRIELKSLINGKKTKGSVNNNYNNQLKGATIYALKIKTGYTKKIINWFKKTYKKNIWINYFNNALSNCSISARLLYFVYENKGKLPTVKDLYGTKIVHHGVSTKKNNRTRKKRGGQVLTKEQKEQLAKRFKKAQEVIKKRTENLRASPLLNTPIKAELPRLFSPITVPSEKKEKKGGRKRSTKKKTRKKRGGDPKKYEIGAKWKPKNEHPNLKTTLEILPWDEEDVISTFRLTKEEREQQGEEALKAEVERLRSEDVWLLLSVKQIDTTTKETVQSHKTLQTEGDLYIKGIYIGSVEHGGGKRGKKTRKKRGGKRRKTRKKRGGDGIKGGKCAVCLEENSATHQFCERTETTVIEKDKKGNETERTTHAGGHFFCPKCIAEILKTTNSTNRIPGCPICRKPYRPPPHLIDNEGMGEWIKHDGYLNFHAQEYDGPAIPRYSYGDCCTNCGKTLCGKLCGGKDYCNPCIKSELGQITGVDKSKKYECTRYRWRRASWE